ncbi:MAG: immune inhibitor A, partial [Xanthomonadales bacterium]|nr:immune inhibitor A [Xanthomonadales bacterium]
NPLAGLLAWCNLQDWTKSVVDIDAFAGQTAQFRFRLGSDGSVGQEGWYIDDVKVQSCRDESFIFEDGFEN